MSMRIRQHVIDNVVFLRLEGAMIIDDDRDFLKQRVAELLEGRQAKIVLDLENCLRIIRICGLARRKRPSDCHIKPDRIPRNCPAARAHSCWGMS